MPRVLPQKVQLLPRVLPQRVQLLPRNMRLGGRSLLQRAPRSVWRV
jgi:hypothetical protein